MKKLRRLLGGSGTLLALSAVAALGGILIKHRAERSGEVRFESRATSRLSYALEDRGVKFRPLLDVATSLDPRAVMSAVQIVRGTHPSVSHPVQMDMYKQRRRNLQTSSKGVLLTSVGMMGFLYGAWQLISGTVSGIFRRAQDAIERSRLVARLLKLADVRPHPVQPDKVVTLILID